MLSQLRARLRPPPPPPLLILDEVFEASTESLGGLVMPLDVLAGAEAETIVLVLLHGATGETRRCTVVRETARRLPRMRLFFTPFRNAPGDRFAIRAANAALPWPDAGDAPPAAEKTPITLDALPADDVPPGLVLDGGAMVACEPKPIDDKSPPLVRVETWLDRCWADRRGLYIVGWVHCYEHPVRSVLIEVGDKAVEIPELEERPELLSFFPQWPHITRCGIRLYVEAPPGEPIHITARTDAGDERVRYAIAEEPPPADTGEVSPFDRFVAAANECGGEILEIGARVVGPVSSARRLLFPKAGRFIGFDIHAAPEVDIAGDAHLLTRYVAPGSLDALFSLSVLEHLMMPWLAAAEINRALKVGGLVFHSTHQSWPIHEAPNDFWRFSDAGLAILFGPDMGFEVIESGMSERMSLVPERQRHGPFLEMPFNPGYGHAYVMARKVRDVGAGTSPEGFAAEALVSQSQRYPVARPPD